MNKYKVGDRVYYRRRKFTIEQLSKNNFKEEFANLSLDGRLIHGMFAVSQFKPIITVRA